MAETLSGGCACGAVRYKGEGKPLYMGNCHCRHCQQATGSAYFPAVLLLKKNFTLEQGEPTWFERQADKGHAMRRAFCAQCGSPLLLENGANPATVVLYAGSLDDPSLYQPSRDIYTASAQPWDLMHPELPKDAAMPDWNRS